MGRNTKEDGVTGIETGQAKYLSLLEFANQLDESSGLSQELIEALKDLGRAFFVATMDGGDTTIFRTHNQELLDALQVLDTPENIAIIRRLVQFHLALTQPNPNTNEAWSAMLDAIANN